MVHMESESTSAVALPGRILVVEDDRQILAIVSLLLEDEGYEIVTASDGRQALARLREGANPDLIILDLMLPSLDGWEFRAIQRADPELARIPVLVVSADASAKARAIDATSFLRKPFGVDDLLDRVRRILSERVRMEARMAETERLVSLGKLAAEATHEMSNPLGSVVANVASIEQLVHRMKDVVHTLPRDLDRPVEAGLVLARVRRAVGVAALAEGKYVEAFTQLRGLFDSDGMPLHNYASFLGVADLAAAAIHAERHNEGRDVIERALSCIDGESTGRLRQLIARARGVLAPPDEAEAHFDNALGDPAGNQWPFERAQLRLDYAEWLRRRRRINEAKPVLMEALGTFHRLGARSWAQRAQAELRASGVTVTGVVADADALDDLTPQQRQIVRLAGEGLSDREIGDRLFLSPRTVSSHLYRSYPKLGVASRHQLRDVIARTGDASRVTNQEVQ